MLIFNQFFLRTVSINASPPFELCDIFTYYDKQGLAASK